MTFTVNPWWVVAVLSLALFGVVFVWRVARDAARDAARAAREWRRGIDPRRFWRPWHDFGPDEETEQEQSGLCVSCFGSDHCDGAVDTCICTCTWPESWAGRDALEELPPERSAEALGFTGRLHRELLYGDGPGTIPSTTTNWPTFLERLEARRERLASAAELEHRAAYEACGFDYPSGLMARVREAAP